MRIFGPLTVVVLVLTGCSSVPAVKVKTWETTAGTWTYPEAGDLPYGVPWLDEKLPFGIVVSGGGTRSAAATLGQLRAINCLGWMEKTRYISAVSGGAWIAVPYTYLPQKIDDDKFLGTYVAPQDLTMEKLEESPDGSFTKAINRAFPFLRAITHWVRFRGDESFAASIGDIFLRPFGLGDRSKFFSFHRQAMEATVSANTSNLREEDFLLAREKRPYLVVGTTLMGKPRPGKRKDFFPVDLTPLYSGTADLENDPWKTDRFFGGGFVESLAFDSFEPKRDDSGMVTAKINRPRYKFTLSDVMAASGSAPQMTLSRFYIDGIGFPEFRQWPIDARHGERETHFGDGGHVENIGLMPLLARKVTNILVFINTASRFKPELNEQKKYPLYGDLIHFFRDETPKKNATPEQAVRQGETFVRVKESDPSRIVIGDGAKKLKELADAYRIAKGEGRPLVYCDKYDIVKNDRFNVSGGYEASICWVYLDKTEGWMEQLKPDVAKRVAKRNFPHYATFFSRGAEVMRLRPADVNGLSNLTAWTVLTEKQKIATELGLPLGENSCEKP